MEAIIICGRTLQNHMNVRTTSNAIRNSLKILNLEVRKFYANNKLQSFLWPQDNENTNYEITTH